MTDQKVEKAAPAETERGLQDVESKRVMEAIGGKWIVESAELSGMRKGEVEKIKAQLSRQFDRARMAYDRIAKEVPRQCVFFGTTNSTEFLRDETGNRRFWPVDVSRFDVAALRRDRDQLWAEAAACEATGESIRLDPRLWHVAGEEQAARLALDPYVDALQSSELPTEGNYKIAIESLWTILDVRAGGRSQEMSMRLANAMRALDWHQNKPRLISIGGKKVGGWMRGDPPFVLVRVSRDEARLIFERVLDPDRP